MVCAYAFAVGEQNAGGGIVVTAPTCGASSVLPAVAGIIGILVKTNASVSGAECGCQAEMGTACSMAAAALAEIFGMRIEQIEYAAEVAMEHHLGLTCDPIAGLVQIPCIERGAISAMRAINALNLAKRFNGRIHNRREGSEFLKQPVRQFVGILAGYGIKQYKLENVMRFERIKPFG